MNNNESTSNSDQCECGMEQPVTVLEWWGAHHFQHRIRVKKVAGSAHWTVLKESRGPGGSYTQEWSMEAKHKPEVTEP